MPHIDDGFHTLGLLFLFLSLLFLFLMGYTYWTRRKERYWQNYEQRFRDHYFHLLLNYAEQAGAALPSEEIIRQISTRSRDYAYFLELLEDLKKVLHGKEHERLNLLVKHPEFLLFYRKKLSAWVRRDKIEACLYFQNARRLDRQTIKHLRELNSSPDLKLAYAATGALLFADQFIIKKKALIRFFRRKDVSEMMVVELLHLFDPKKADERPRIAKVLRELLVRDIDLIPKRIIVRYLGAQRYYICGEFLYQYLKRLQYSPRNIPLIQALLRVMGELQVAEASSLLRNYIRKGTAPVSVRQAAARALSRVGNEEDLMFLMDSLPGAEFSLRKTIIQELAVQDERRMVLVNNFLKSSRQKIVQLQNETHNREETQEAIDQIKDIILALQIQLEGQLNTAPPPPIKPAVSNA